MARPIVFTEKALKEVTGLIRAGHLKWEQRPLWYDVYVAVPPLREPVWDAKFPKENEPVQKIFYEEDVLRALKGECLAVEVHGNRPSDHQN
uniref:Small ribosomal subunit protein mS23 n=1 Tax=Parascaris equorum TaxID=6256 RepID=A0A914S6F0_PAREQ